MSPEAKAVFKTIAMHRETGDPLSGGQSETHAAAASGDRVNDLDSLREPKGSRLLVPWRPSPWQPALQREIIQLADGLATRNGAARFSAPAAKMLPGLLSTLSRFERRVVKRTIAPKWREGRRVRDSSYDAYLERIFLRLYLMLSTRFSVPSELRCYAVDAVS